LVHIGFIEFRRRLSPSRFPGLAPGKRVCGPSRLPDVKPPCSNLAGTLVPASFLCRKLHWFRGGPGRPHRPWLQTAPAPQVRHCLASRLDTDANADPGRLHVLRAERRVIILQLFLPAKRLHHGGPPGSTPRRRRHLRHGPRSGAGRPADREPWGPRRQTGIAARPARRHRYRGRPRRPGPRVILPPYLPGRSLSQQVVYR
jgi:hypothetical protein